MMRELVCIIGLLFVSSFAYAQAPLATYTLRVYNQGAPVAIYGPKDVPIAQLVCGQPKPADPTSTVVNPSKFWLTDPADATKACVYMDPGTSAGVLFAMPFLGTPLEGTVTVTNTVGATSPESARSNLFTHPGVSPTAPQGFRIAGLFRFGSGVFGFRRGSVVETPHFLRLVGDTRR